MGGLARRSLVIAASLGLGGCGFRAMYATRAGRSGGPGADLSAIRVGVIPDRAGQLVRQELQQRLDHGEGLAKRYELAVGFSLAADAVGVQRDSTATRVRMVGTANWSLRRLEPPQLVVTTGLARSLDGVNVIDQQYFEADLAGETATKRIASNVAEQITLQLAAYFAEANNAA